MESKIKTNYWDNKYYYEAFNEEIKNFITRQKEKDIGYHERQKFMEKMDKEYPEQMKIWHKAWSLRINYLYKEIYKRAFMKWLRKPIN